MGRDGSVLWVTDSLSNACFDPPNKQFEPDSAINNAFVASLDFRITSLCCTLLWKVNGCRSSHSVIGQGNLAEHSSKGRGVMVWPGLALIHIPHVRIYHGTSFDVPHLAVPLGVLDSFGRLEIWESLSSRYIDNSLGAAFNNFWHNAHIRNLATGSPVQPEKLRPSILKMLILDMTFTYDSWQSWNVLADMDMDKTWIRHDKTMKMCGRQFYDSWHFMTITKVLKLIKKRAETQWVSE